MVSFMKVGTNLMNVVIGRKQEVTVRELGGCMAPIWKDYFNNCKNVMVRYILY